MHTHRDQVVLEQLELRRLFAAMPTYIDVDQVHDHYDGPFVRETTISVRNLYAGADAPSGRIHLLARGNEGYEASKLLPLDENGKATFQSDWWPASYTITYIDRDGSHRGSSKTIANPDRGFFTSSTTLSATEVSRGVVRLRAEVTGTPFAVERSYALGTVTFTTSDGTVLGEATLDASGVVELLVQTDGTGIKPNDMFRATYSGEKEGGLPASAGEVVLTAAWHESSEVHFVDINGDGHVDRVARDAADGIYRIELIGSKGVFHRQSLPPVGAGWTLREIADLSGDGNAELVWQSANGKTTAWVRQPGNAFSFSLIGTVRPGWILQGDGDFNADGDTDLLWRDSVTGATCVWMMNGTAARGFEQLAMPSISNDWAVGEISDFNDDGKMDLLWRNSRSGANYLWFLDGTRITGGRSLDRLAADGWSLAGIFDLDDDGDEDVLFYHRGTGTTLAWLMEDGEIASADQIVL